MNDNDKKIEIKTSLLITIICIALFLLLSVVFLVGFLLGSNGKKDNIQTPVLVTRGNNEKQNISFQSGLEQKEEKDESKENNKRIGFVPFGGKEKNKVSNYSSMSSSKNEKEDTRNLSALFSSDEEQNNYSYNSNSNYYQSKSSNSSVNYSSNNNISSESGKEAVKNYFIELESKLSGSKTWTDPNQFAEQLLRSAMTGDFSDLTNLTETMKRVANEIENMKIPFECSEHRNSVVASLKDSISILNKVEQGIDSGDMQIILSLTSDAEKLKSNAEKSDEIMKKLKSKYNI